MKSAQNAPFAHNRSQNRRTGLNHRQAWKTERCLWKLHKTHVWDRAEQVLAKFHLPAHHISKSSYWPQVITKSGKQIDFYERCTKRTFWAMRSKFCENLTFEHSRPHNRRAGLQSSPNRVNSAISINDDFEIWCAKKLDFAKTCSA